jgi:SAM-dependent methyltransferase
LAAYARAIFASEPGDVVVDVGSGTGVLAMMALRRGFKHAILVEPSRKISLYARHIAELNGVADRVTIVTSKLEETPLDAFPGEIDLLLSETLSSLVFGFGSWDVLPALAERACARSGTIPTNGSVFACLCTKPFASRGNDSNGLLLLQRLRINIDLFERTFRSGGNVYDKRVVSRALLNGDLLPGAICSFDFSGNGKWIDLSGGCVPVPGSGTYTGLLLYWIVQLSRGDGGIFLSSTDAALTSWYPFYIPFRTPITLASHDEMYVRIALHPIDAPYKYAFQIVGHERELTEVLYW